MAAGLPDGNADKLGSSPRWRSQSFCKRHARTPSNTRWMRMARRSPTTPHRFHPRRQGHPPPRPYSPRVAGMRSRRTAKHLCARASAVPGGRAHLCHQGCRQWRGCQRPRHRRHRRPQPASPPVGGGGGWRPAQPPVAVGHPRRRPFWRRAVGVDAAVDEIVETQGGVGVAGEAPGPTGKPTPQPPEYPRLLARPPARGCRPAAGPSRVAAPPLLTVALPMPPSATARIVTTTAAVSRGCT